MFGISLALFAFTASSLFADAPKKLLLVGQGPDGHPPQTHEYMSGVNIIEKLLKSNKGIEITNVKADGPWKEGPELMERADGVVFFVSEGAKWLQDATIDVVNNPVLFHTAIPRPSRRRRGRQR